MKVKEETVKNLLAAQLGIDAEDIHNDDSLVDDLHMNPSDITDFSQSLENEGIDISDLDFTQIDTISDVLEALGVEDYS